MPRTIDKQALEKLLKNDLAKKNITKKAVEPLKHLITKYKNEKDKKKMIEHGLKLLKNSELKAGKKRKLRHVLKDDKLLVEEPPKKKRKINKIKKGGQPQPREDEQQMKNQPQAPKSFTGPILKPLNQIPNEQIRKPVEKVDQSLLNEIYSAKSIAQAADSNSQQALNMAQKASYDAAEVKTAIQRFDPEKKQSLWTELEKSIAKLNSDLANFQKKES